MVSYCDFSIDDMLHFNAVNLDQLTETYSNQFYGWYFTTWPASQTIARHPCGLVMGYLLGKSEGTEENWHGHVSAVTVAPTFRRLGIADTLMKRFEAFSELIDKCYFVDLFVRAGNEVALKMYKKQGYIVYRKVAGYYSGSGGGKSEDAVDMRKPLVRDKERTKGSACIPTGKTVRPRDLEWD